MAKPTSKRPERESATRCLLQDSLDQLKELDVGLRALTLQMKAGKIRRKRRTEAARQGIKPWKRTLNRRGHGTRATPRSSAGKEGRNGKIKPTARPRSAHPKH